MSVANPLTPEQLALAVHCAGEFMRPDSTSSERHQLGEMLLRTRPDLAGHSPAVRMTAIMANAVVQLADALDHASCNKPSLIPRPRSA